MKRIDLIAGARPNFMKIYELIGTDPRKISPALARLMAEEWKKGAIPSKWDGKAAERIVEHMERLLAR